MKSFTITLRDSEALVLFEWLATFDSCKSNFPDEATQKVLWHIEGLLEQGLPQVLASNYLELLLAAKTDVLYGVDGATNQ